MALQVTEQALKGELVSDFRGVLDDYKRRCEVKLRGREKANITQSAEKSK